MDITAARRSGPLERIVRPRIAEVQINKQGRASDRDKTAGTKKNAQNLKKRFSTEPILYMPQSNFDVINKLEGDKESRRACDQ